MAGAPALIDSRRTCLLSRGAPDPPIRGVTFTAPARVTVAKLWYSPVKLPVRTMPQLPHRITSTSSNVVNPASHRPPSWRSSVARRRQSDSISAPVSSRSVSYTHLRAHETDSYLVC